MSADAAGSQSNGYSKASKVLGVVVLALTLLGMTLAGGKDVAVRLWGLTPQEAHDADVARIRARQDSINTQMLRKLDCALFDLPRDCRSTLAPR